MPMRPFRTNRRKAKATAMPVEVQMVTAVEELPSAAQITFWATTAMSVVVGNAQDMGHTDVCIRVVGEDEARAMNKAYRGKNKPTNVLSFPAEVDLPETRILGDIVICAKVVRDEAMEQKKDVADHFAHMVVHGMLHLLGHDHEVAGQAQAMEALEREILGRFDVSDPYREI